jgi:hypothetical protein
MTDPARIVLSASRRSDIPAFYLDWFLEGIQRGHFDVIQPYNRRRLQVPATPDRVHTIVFWSKDFGAFLDRGVGEDLLRRGFHLFFNFTVNSENRLLEPKVPALERRLDQMVRLAQRFGPAAIHWRFDPICRYRTPDGRRGHNQTDFLPIAQVAARAGIRRCITSFVDLYPKVERRAARCGVVFEDPPPEVKSALFEAMAADLAPLGITLETCCENEALAGLEPYRRVRPASCIPSERLMALYGGRLSRRRDPGQRRRSGCRCGVSCDIGSYALHPCHHGCLFCYAA